MRPLACFPGGRLIACCPCVSSAMVRLGLGDGKG